jgi:hypothetical protein
LLQELADAVAAAFAKREQLLGATHLPAEA